MSKNTKQSLTDPVELDFVRKIGFQFIKNKKGKPPMIVKISSVSLPPTAEWKVPDFMKYYQKLYTEKYKVAFKFNASAWKSFSGTVKQFAERHQLSPENYKDFLDVLFSDICNSQFIPSPGFMTSDKLFQRYQTLKVNKKSFPKSDINRFKKEKEKLSSRPIFTNSSGKFSL